ncbi:MAG: hypothetical protein GXO60_02570 [Epsilonproteobacteria bacterium]|nr:hypothetical protein [Campylobacterota bacterium]
MSYTENFNYYNYIETICDAIKSYKGFTTSEKEYGLQNIHKWIEENGNLDTFIKKFSEISLDINPFISEYKLSTI